jgi:stearoyl-CoA desaturase (delta-9 desaturase)
VTVAIDERRPDEHIEWKTTIPFLALHAVPLLAVFTGVTWKAVGLGVALYGIRSFFITAGYHRYFSHKTFRVSRPVQLILAFGGTTAAQKGPLWWSAHHRLHHRFSDTPDDLHSPRKGFWFSHIGWILSQRSKPTDLERVPDLARYPELRFLDRHDFIGPWAVGIFSFWFAGLPGLVVGFFGSTIALWHTTYTVNSLAHVVGRRRYATDDTSRNNWLIALFTGGEGWHNNHHHYPASARQGFFWWEVDTSWYALRLLSWVGLVRDLRVPSAKVKRAGWVRDGTFDRGLHREALDRAAALVRLTRRHTGGDASLAAADAAEDALDVAAEAGRRLAVARRDIPSATPASSPA